MKNWEKMYAYSFRDPSNEKSLAFAELENIADELNTEIKKYREDLSVNFHETVENNAEIALPEGKIIKIRFYPEIDKIELRAEQDKFAVIEKVEGRLYFRHYSKNLIDNPIKKVDGINRETLNFALSLLIRTLREF